MCSDRLDTDFPDIDLSQLDTSDFDSVNCLSELQWCNDQPADASPASIHYSTADELFEVGLFHQNTVLLYCATDAFYQLQAAINIHQNNTICIYVSHMFLNEKTPINKIHQWTDWDLMPLVHLEVHAQCVRSAHAKLNAQTSACRRKESPSLTNSNPDCFRFKDNPHRWQSEALILTVKFSNPICQLAPRSQQQWFSNNIILWIFQKLIYA